MDNAVRRRSDMRMPWTCLVSSGDGPVVSRHVTLPLALPTIKERLPPDAPYRSQHMRDDREIPAAVVRDIGSLICWDEGHRVLGPGPKAGVVALAIHTPSAMRRTARGERAVQLERSAGDAASWSATFVASNRLEAESAAFVVCAALGIDRSDYSFGYLVGWSGGGDEAVAQIKSAGARVQSNSRPHPGGRRGWGRRRGSGIGGTGSSGRKHRGQATLFPSACDRAGHVLARVAPRRRPLHRQGRGHVALRPPAASLDRGALVVAAARWGRRGACRSAPPEPARYRPR